MEYNMNKPIYWYKNRADSEMQFLVMFIEDVENQCNENFQKYKSGLKTDIIEEDEERNYVYDITHYRGLDSDSWDLDSIFSDYFPNLNRGSALITIFGFFENEMDRLCYIFMKNENYKVRLNDFKNKGLERSIPYLNKVAELNIKTDNPLWKRIINIQEVRNRFTHHRGHLSTSEMFEGDDDFNLDFDVLDFEDKGKKKKDIYFLKEEKNLELSGDMILIKEGYLKEVLSAFSEFYKSVDEQIQKKYSSPKN